MSQSKPRQVISSQGRPGQLKAKSTVSCRGCAERRILCDKSLPNCMRCTSDGLLCIFPSEPPASSQGQKRPGFNRIDSSKINQELSALTLSSSGGQTTQIRDIAPVKKASPPKPKDEVVPGQDPRNWNASADEMRSLQFFTEVTTRAFTAFNPASEPFFMGCVPQASLQEPLIKHLLISISKAHEATITGSQDIFTQSLTYLGQGLQESMTITSQSSKSQVMLIACQLFFILYMLHDNEPAAGQHIRFGMQLLRQLRNQSKGSVQISSNSILRTREGNLFTAYSDEEESAAEGKNTKASPLARTKARMEAIVNRLEQCSDVDREITALPSRYSYLMDVIPWTASTSNAMIYQSQLLDSYFTISDMQSECDTEMDWDQHTEKFRALLAMCAENMNQQPASGLSRYPGPLPPLYTIAMKCRDLRVRAAAIELMKRHCSKQGMSRPSIITIAESVMRLEESAKSHVTGSISERNRIRAVASSWRAREEEKVTLSWAPYGPSDALRVVIGDLDYVVVDLARSRLKIQLS